MSSDVRRRNMRTIFIVLLAMCLSGLAIASEVTLHDSVLTLTGYYKSRDGRVSEHKFPVEIRLLADGKFKGTWESWIEARLSDGTSRLQYLKQPFSGNWSIKAETIRLTVTEAGFFSSESVSFKKINGLQVTIEKEKTPNK